MKKILPIALAALLLLGACRSSKPVAARFYMLEYPAKQEMASDTLLPLPYSVEIMDIDLNPAFSTHQIALREDAHEVKYFVNHQWASRPQKSLERFVVNYFNDHGLFENVQRSFWNVQPDFRLYITIYNLEVVRDRKDFSAHLHLEMWLESAQGEVIHRHLADQTRMLEKRSLNLFAQAINNMFYEELNYFATKLHFALTPAK